MRTSRLARGRSSGHDHRVLTGVAASENHRFLDVRSPPGFGTWSAVMPRPLANP